MGTRWLSQSLLQGGKLALRTSATRRKAGSACHINDLPNDLLILCLGRFSCTERWARHTVRLGHVPPPSQPVWGQGTGATSRAWLLAR